MRYLMERQDELRHLRDGPRKDEKPPMLDYFTARCPGNAESVLKNCKEVLQLIFSQDIQDWPSDAVWVSLLPRRFVEACAPEMTEEEVQRYSQWWFSLSWEEKLRFTRDESNKKWSVGSFVYWFRPEADERQWWWWDAKVENAHVLHIAVAIEGLPYASGALEWLLLASGATEVEKGN